TVFLRPEQTSGDHAYYTPLQPNYLWKRPERKTLIKNHSGTEISGAVENWNKGGDQAGSQKPVVHEMPHSGVEGKPFFEGKLYYTES
ncbi:unnamed protein product, partial [Gulo gulo]